LTDSVYVFKTEDEQTWTQSLRINSPDDGNNSFGTRVAIDSSICFIGAPNFDFPNVNDGIVYAYRTSVVTSPSPTSFVSSPTRVVASTSRSPLTTATTQFERLASLSKTNDGGMIIAVIVVASFCCVPFVCLCASFLFMFDKTRNSGDEHRSRRRSRSHSRRYSLQLSSSHGVTDTLVSMDLESKSSSKSVVGRHNNNHDYGHIVFDPSVYKIMEQPSLEEGQYGTAEAVNEYEGTEKKIGDINGGDNQNIYQIMFPLETEEFVKVETVNDYDRIDQTLQ